MSDWSVDPAREAQWEAQRAECYRRWREEKLASCAAYVNSSRNRFERDERLKAIRTRLGRPGQSFMAELYKRLEGAA